MSGFRFALALCVVLPVLAGAPAWSQTAAPSAQTAQGVQKVLTLEEQEKGKALTLEDAVRYGLENNPTIKAARERVGTQEAVLREQFAAYYPTININGTYQDGTQSGTTGISRIAVLRAQTLRMMDVHFVQVSPTFSLILYNFGQREATVQSARETLSSTQYNLKATADTVVVGVKQAYYSYLQAVALVKVRQEAVDDRDLTLRQARAFFQVGTRARIDVARAEANVYSAQSDLISAQNTMKVAWVTLKNAMGLPDFPEQPVSGITAAQVEGSAATTFPLSLDQGRNQAFNIRPEIKSFEAQLRAQDQVIATNRRAHLPTVTLNTNYSARHVSNDPELLPFGIGTPVGNKFRSIFPLEGTWQAQVSVSIPIFNGFLTTNKVDESVHTYYGIKAQAEQERQQVALEVEQGYANLISAQERIKSTKSAQDAAKENLDLANGRYQVGVGSIIEVTDAQTTLSSAQVDYVNSLASYKIAEAQLLKAVGTP